MRLPEPPLLLVTDRRQARQPLTDVVAAALAAGCRWVSLREKDLPADAQVRLMSDLLPLARRWSARLTVHGAASLAQLGGAGGVHLVATGDAKAARADLGRGALIGQSVHTEAKAEALDGSVLDYVIAGPVYPTASKPGYGPALGCGGLASIVKASPVPVVAIGGIDTANVAEVRMAGAAGIAVMGGVMRAADPGRQTRELLEALRCNGRPS